MKCSVPTEFLQLLVSRFFETSPGATDGNSVANLVSISVTGAVLDMRAVGDKSMSFVAAEVAAEEDGSATIDMHTFYKAVTGFVPETDKGVGSALVKITTNDQTVMLDAIHKVGGKSIHQKRRIAIRDASIPKISLPSKDKFIPVPLTLLNTALKKVSYSIHNKLDGADSAGVVINLDHTKLLSASTNGISLTQYTTSFTQDYGESQSVVESAFVSKLLRVMSHVSSPSDKDLVYLYNAENILWVKIGEFLIAGPLKLAPFPKYEHLLAGKDKKVIIDRNLLLLNIQNILYSLSREDNFRLTLKFIDDSLTVSADSCENTDIPLLNTGHNIQLDFNGHLLEGALAAFDCEFCVFSYENRNSPIIIEPYDSELQQLMLLAPLR